MSGPAKVLITEADGRCAPAACESLSRAGYGVGTVSSEGLSPAQWSRFSNHQFRATNPRDSSRSFAEEVATIARDGGFATVMCGGDSSLVAISENRDLFDGVVELGLPPAEVVDECIRKTSLLEKGRQAGLVAPETVSCADPAEARSAASRLGYPVLLKPRGTVFSANGRVQQKGSAMVRDQAELEAELPKFGLPCLLQRREIGPVVSVGGVFAEGRLLAVAPSRYIRTWQPDAGNVTFSKTIDPPAPLLARVESLLASFGWQGIFELEVIERADGNLTAIDFNPRLYGSLALAVRAGASLPAIWCDWLLRSQAGPTQTANGATRTARKGMYYRWDDGDWRHVWRHLRDGRPGSALSVLRPRRHTAHPYFSGKDPVPGIIRGVQMLRNVASKAAAR